MQVSGNSGNPGIHQAKKKQPPKQNENQQPPIPLHQPQNNQPPQGINNRLNVTA